MKFEDYWERLCQKTPQLKDESTTMHLTVHSFKKSVKRAFDAGRMTQEGLDKAAKDFEKVGKFHSPFEDLFGHLFR